MTLSPRGCRELKAIKWRRKDKVRYYKVECTGWDRMTEVKEQQRFWFDESCG